MLGIKALKAEMGIQKKPTKTENSVLIHFRVESDVAKALIKLADREGLSVSRCAARLICEHLEE